MSPTKKPITTIEYLVRHLPQWNGEQKNKADMDIHMESPVIKEFENGSNKRGSVTAKRIVQK